MRAGYCALVVLATTLVANCGGTSGDQTPNSVSSPNDPGPPAPTVNAPFLDYARPLVFTSGVSETMWPDNLSSDTTITISPALPPGLTLDRATGAISGTPTALSAGQSYTLSAANAQGTVTAKLDLEVNDGPLFYTSPAILAVGSETSLTPNGTTYLSEFSVSPALPTGLALDTTTGVISGTPAAASPPTYYIIAGSDVGFDREFGLTLGVSDPSVPTAQIPSASKGCLFSGGFVGTFSADSIDRSYGLIAIAFTPDGHTNARIGDLITGIAYTSDGSEELNAATDGSFVINFSDPSNRSLHGTFKSPDLISGTYQKGSTSKPFTAFRLGGSAAATYRYTGGFGSSNGYRVDFGTIDIAGSALTGAGYQMGEADQGFVLTNRQLTFEATISGGMFTVTVDSSTTHGDYTPNQSRLVIGDPYDSRFYVVTYGCQLN